MLINRTHLRSSALGLGRRYYGSLLSHHKSFIRRFAAESLAYLLRKLRPEDVSSVLLQLTALPPLKARSSDPATADDKTEHTGDQVDLSPSDEYRDGVAALLFETVKVTLFNFLVTRVLPLMSGPVPLPPHTQGVQHRFHSALPDVLPVLVRLPSVETGLVQSPEVQAAGRCRTAHYATST